MRAFNNRYGPTFPEPQAVYTEAPVVLGTDGVRKMSKSIGNTIEIFAPADEIRRQVMSMVTDTQRIKRTDPGRPEVCNVCQLHRFFGDDYEEIWDGERTARTGCVDTKKLLVERILRHYAPARERYAELMASPAARRRRPRGRRRAAAPDRGRDDGRGPREDGTALSAARAGATIGVPADRPTADAARPHGRPRRAAGSPRHRCPSRSRRPSSERQQRWLTAFLVLGSAAFALVVLSYLATYWNFFADVILTFFLAWLLAFILILARAAPHAGRPAAPAVIAAVVGLRRPDGRAPRPHRDPRPGALQLAPQVHPERPDAE